MNYRAALISGEETYFCTGPILIPKTKVAVSQGLTFSQEPNMSTQLRTCVLRTQHRWRAFHVSCCLAETQHSSESIRSNYKYEAKDRLDYLWSQRNGLLINLCSGLGTPLLSRILLQLCIIMCIKKSVESFLASQGWWFNVVGISTAWDSTRQSTGWRSNVFIRPFPGGLWVISPQGVTSWP